MLNTRPCQVSALEMFSPVSVLSLHVRGDVLSCSEFSGLLRSNSPVSLVDFAFAVMFKNPLPCSRSRGVTPVFLLWVFRC